MAYYDNTGSSWNALAIGMNALNDARRFELEKKKQGAVNDSLSTGVDSEGNIIDQQAYENTKKAVEDRYNYYHGNPLTNMFSDIGSVIKSINPFKKDKYSYKNQATEDTNKRYGG